MGFILKGDELLQICGVVLDHVICATLCNEQDDLSKVLRKDTINRVTSAGMRHYLLLLIATNTLIVKCTDDQNLCIE